MSIISRLLRKKEPEVAVVVPRTRKHWRDKKCSGSGAKAMIPTGAIDGYRSGICGVCGHVGRPTKNGFVAGHLKPADD